MNNPDLCCCVFGCLRAGLLWAHLKRINFAATSGMPDKIQMDLFNEMPDIDLAAIEAVLNSIARLW